jgi:hypothetical protein
MIDRRTLLKFSMTGLAVAALPVRLWADAAKGMAESALIYITPLKQDGSESSCQAEVWFQLHDGAMYVVTSSKAWRAVAVGKGRSSARVWVGDVGQWKSADGKYRALPVVTTQAALVGDKGVQTAVLAKMGAKYSAEWSTWGPRFNDGLADGSRVMLRYTPV